jgi:hypothetical protein
MNLVERGTDFRREAPPGRKADARRLKPSRVTAHEHTQIFLGQSTPRDNGMLT